MVASFWTWDGWEALVAIGTLGLAGATAFLALKTKRLAATTEQEVQVTEREVRAVESQVAVAQSSLESTVRPVLVQALGADVGGSAFEISRQPGSIVVTLWLRNAGEGIAFLRDVVMGWEGGQYRRQGEASSGTVPRGEAVRLVFLSEATDVDALDFAALLGRGDFSIKVEYSDLAGNVWTTRADTFLHPVSSAWSVSGIVLEAHGKTPVVGWAEFA